MAQYEVQSLNIFPIKSLRGISVSAISVGPSGFVHDREWMLIDAKGQFLTQRQLTRMALIDVVIRDHHLHVKAPEANVLIIPLDSHEGSVVIQVKIWNDYCSGILESQSTNRWFSDFLGVDCRLVRFNQSQPRQLDQDYSSNLKEQVQFADGFPFLVIGTASLDDLNNRLIDKGMAAIPMMRFRPNIVIKTDQPFIEDSWKNIQIGAVKMKVVKPCSRCVIPTIDINSGLKSKEPIETLKTYRRHDGKIYFGQNIIHEYQVQQTLKVGDLVKY